MTALMDRLKSASGSSRDLDKEIAVAFDMNQYLRANVEVPRFTASVEAAFLLLDPEHYFLIGKGKLEPEEPLFCAQVFLPSMDDPIGEGEHNATLALALCIAALDALTLQVTP